MLSICWHHQQGAAEEVHLFSSDLLQALSSHAGAPEERVQEPPPLRIRNESLKEGSHLSSSGCTATAVSPSMVSGRVVATTISSSPSSSL